MNEKDHIREELEGLSPLLARAREMESWKKQQHPGADYFQSLPDEVLRRAKAEESLYGSRTSTEAIQKETAISWWGWLQSGWRPWGLSVGMIALAVILVYQLMPTNTSASVNTLAQLDDLESETINEYVNNNISDFELDLFIEAELTDDAIVNEILSTDISDEALDQYLEDILDEVDLDDLEEIL